MTSPPNIDPANTWITSDSHFGHKNIAHYAHRPTDIDQTQMEEWARFVPEDGTLLHLGDLSWTNNGMFKHVISKHLTGNPKLLIRGNHDKSPGKFYEQAGFKLVRPFSLTWTPPGELKGSFQVSFSHYPWNPEEDGPLDPKHHVHIHGHIHNNGYFWAGKGEREWSDRYYTPFVRGQINMSVEQTKYRPVLLEPLLVGHFFGADAVHKLYQREKPR